MLKDFGISRFLFGWVEKKNNEVIQKIQDGYCLCTISAVKILISTFLENKNEWRLIERKALIYLKKVNLGWRFRIYDEEDDYIN